MDGVRLIGKYEIELPVKLEEATPWTEVDIDLINLYTVKIKILVTNNSPITLLLTAMMLINHRTGNFEIAKVPNIDRTPACISRLFNQTWL